MGYLDLFRSYNITAAEVAVRPEIVPCSKWGSSPAKEPATLIIPTEHIFHHTAGANRPPQPGWAGAFVQGQKTALSIQQAHFAIGDSDTGQHFTIMVEGLIFEGRHGSRDGYLSGGPIPQGAQAIHSNGISVGSEHEGNFMVRIPNRKMLCASLSLNAWGCLVYGWDSHTAEDGHRDVCTGPDATACPGDAFYTILPALRDIIHGAVLLLRDRWYKNTDGVWTERA